MATVGCGNEDEAQETQRLEAFSDGVFAIAVTLLILEIRAPSQHDIGADSELWHALRDLWPAYLAYIISFATISASPRSWSPGSTTARSCAWSPALITRSYC